MTSLPVFSAQSFFVGFTLRAGWWHAEQTDSTGASTSAINRVDALPGLRLGVRAGTFEFFFGFGAGPADMWSVTRQQFVGWSVTDVVGVGFQAGLGLRLQLAEHVSFFLLPAEIAGSFWPGPLDPGLTADFLASAGLDIRL